MPLIEKRQLGRSSDLQMYRRPPRDGRNRLRQSACKVQTWRGLGTQARRVEPPTVVTSVHIPREADGGATLAACKSLSFLVATRAAFGGFALKTAATFDVSYWLQVTNYGVLYVLFDSAPSESNYIDVWDLCLHAQTASTIISSQPFSDESGESKPKSCLIACAKAARITNRPLPSIRSCNRAKARSH